MNPNVVFNVLFFLITLVLILYLYFKWIFTYWNRKGVKTFSASFPFGNLGDVALGRVSLQEIFKKLYRNFKSKGLRYAGFYFINKPMLVLFDTELVKDIFIKDFEYFTDHGFFEANDYDTYSSHVFGMKGDKWKKMREKLTPLFTSGKLKIMFSTIESCSIELENIIENAAENLEVINIKDIAGRYSTDIIASVGFGIESNSLKNPVSDFRKYGERAVGNSDLKDALSFTLQFLIPDLLAALKIPQISPDITNFFAKLVESTIKYREENNVTRKDFMQLMIQLKNNADVSDKNDSNCFNLESLNNNITKDNKGVSLSMEEIAAQTLFFFIAGYDTSSITTTFCMYELAFNQDIQEKVREEINNVLSRNDGKMSYNAITEMTYMDKCIKETLRKYPTLAYLFRKCTKTYKIPDSDLVIEEGQMVLIPAQEFHYDAEYFPNPEKFDPERFSPENVANRQSFTYLPFGEGPRICIGARLGLIQIKVALTKLLGNFKYTPHSRTIYPVQRAPRSLIVAAKGGISLYAEKINT